MIGKKLLIAAIVSCMLFTGAALAQEEASRDSDLEQRVEDLQQQLDELREEQQKDTESLKDRVSETERHTAADKVELSVMMEPRLWSLHMQDVRSSYQELKQNMSSFQNKDAQFIQKGLKSVEPSKIDVDNDAVRTLRFRLRMDSQVNDNLRFAGRVAAYKVWGDSVGINFN
ncbi:MAG: DUF3373 family protein, partial [Desulfohalobiaceae bacterium]